jgi:hypothetical protein
MWHGNVVGVEESNEVAACDGYAMVPRRPLSGRSAAHAANRVTERLCYVGAVVL